jgi:ribokinase
MLVCGGNAFYTAVGISLWDGPVGIVTRIGSDYPEDMLQDFSEAGFQLEGVMALDGPHLLRGTILYHDDGSREFLFPGEEEISKQQGQSKSLGEEARLTLADFNPVPVDLPDRFWSARGFGLASMDAAAQKEFVSKFVDQDKFFTWDSPDLDGRERELIPYLPHARAFLPGVEEIGWLVNNRDIENILKVLAWMGPEMIALKRGRLGSSIYEVQTGTRWDIPAVLTAEVVDPTGAGDAFCGGFLAGYCQTGDVLEAGLRGTVSASFVIEGFDARYALDVPREKVMKRLAEVRSLVKSGGNAIRTQGRE